MIYQFKSTDDELFVLDVVKMRWGRASSIISAPSIAAVDNKLASWVFTEEGDLIPMGAGAYNLQPRMPNAKEGPAPGLSTVGIMAVPFEDKLVLYLRPNVPVKPESFVSGFPEEAQKFIKYQILQPNEQAALAQN